MVLAQLCVDDLLCEHAVDHQEGRLEEEDGVDVLALLAVEVLDLGLDDLERQQADLLGALGHHANEAVVDEVDLVDPSFVTKKRSSSAGKVVLIILIVVIFV